MKTVFRLYDGRTVTVEHTTTAILAQPEGAPEPKAITSTDYMKIVMCGNIIGEIQ
jgi:hypothetical protein